MMLRAKLLLLWLLALAIPVQGFAAVLQACAPAMQQAAQAHPMPHQMPHHPLTTPAQAHQHQHEHAPHASHDMSPLAMADHDAPHSQHHADASCSFCAACTVGAILPLALGSVPAPDLPSREFLAQPTAGFVGYLPENPDRPPALA
ncbi:hypothetical protein RB25_21230 [Herbaspirillum rubrisubalbicans]|uniref:DUF2946 domain-containing protein n=1 Tax=Herbaspirillum rubrisubalbicans TaxID=80842 RepID=A0ABX9BW20_9BURK|nr:hypothetical protein [Herbaspirillum rubrisubalbicans]RAM61849.1 hypothetical protein RB24_23720 [Herbaspirillum rubrisubalbicans]RAN43920.1 hypothetical protein RB25_21230 [Herbaspirillum rubrisubalbicans]